MNYGFMASIYPDPRPTARFSARSIACPSCPAVADEACDAERIHPERLALALDI